MKKISVKAKYEKLVQALKTYIEALQHLKAQTAGVYPAYGKPGEENSPTKSLPNVVFVKDLINQVQTAQALGYRTQLTARAGELLVEFVENIPTILSEMLYPGPL
jgi:hypothetical protein